MSAGPGTTLADRYQLQRRIGAGGMASVWLALDERLRRPVAIKIVADTLAGDEQWVRRFQREAQAAAALSHPGVVPVFDYGVQEGRPYLVMEHITGGTLADRLAGGSGDHTEEGPPDAAVVARELLEALGAVHASGILHRDVKPANLLLDDRGHVRLTDFGIAQPEDGTTLTRTGMVIGTLRYLAPEVAAGDPASVQSDLYSAGVVIRQLADARPAPAVAGLVAALTADDPAQRPASAADALALLEDETAPTQPVSALTRPLTGLAGARTAVMPARAARRSKAGTARRVAAAPRQPSGSGGAGASRPSATTPARFATGIRRPALAAGLAAVLVVVILVVVLASGGSSPSSGANTTAAAPESAPVAQQVQALEAIVNHAQQR